MSLFERALRDHQGRQSGDPAAETIKQPREVGSGTYSVEEADTLQPIDEDNWFTVQEYGIPRGPEALEAKQLGSTAAMEIVKNTITDQITGGDLAFPSEEEELPDEVVALQDIFGQILSGPHLLGDDFDDLVAAAVSDMVDVGDAYWQTLAADGAESDVPVLALKPLDALTMRINVDESGNWPDGDDEPAYYQAPYQSYAGNSIAIGDTEPISLSRDDVVTLRWPGSRRADRVYPLSPTMQVKQWLEFLSNNVSHLNRFYNDNEIPAGIVSVIEGTDAAIDDITDTVEDAAGDPRTAPVVGSEAKWVEMGGTALNLDIIEEQKWFLQLCWGAVGINKHEVGLVEDVNRNTASEQSTVIYKRITNPLTDSIEQAVERQVLEQFEPYRALDRPFGFAVNYSDPEREAQREQELLERYQAGAIAYGEYRRQLGEEPEDTEVTLPNGETFDYGPHPKHVGEILINAHKNAGGSSDGSDPVEDPVDGDGDDPIDDQDGDGEDGDDDGSQDDESDDQDESDDEQ